MLILPTWIPYSNDTSESQSIILLLLLMTWFFFCKKETLSKLYCILLQIINSKVAKAEEKCFLPFTVLPPIGEPTPGNPCKETARGAHAVQESSRQIPLAGDLLWVPGAYWSGKAQ